MRPCVRNISCLVATLLLSLALMACGEDEPDFGTDPEKEGVGRNAPNVLVDGGGRRADRGELERPIERMVDRVVCPSQVALGVGAKFTCDFSDPELGTGAIVVEQVDESGTLEYESTPRSSTEFSGSFSVEP